MLTEREIRRTLLRSLILDAAVERGKKILPDAPEEQLRRVIEEGFDSGEWTPEQFGVRVVSSREGSWPKPA